jgi:hypothetical protein
LAKIGLLYEQAGDAFTEAGLTGAALSGVAAIAQPETSPADSAGVDVGLGFVAVSGPVAAYGIALQGIAAHGALYGISAGALSWATGQLTGAIGGRLSGNKVARAVIGAMLDNGLAALDAERLACGISG